AGGLGPCHAGGAGRRPDRPGAVGRPGAQALAGEDPGTAAGVARARDGGKRPVGPVLVRVVTFGTWSSFTLSRRSCSCHKANPATPERNTPADTPATAAPPAPCPPVPSPPPPACPTPPSRPGGESLANSRPPPLPPKSLSPSCPSTSATIRRSPGRHSNSSSATADSSASPKALTRSPSDAF